MRVAVVHGYFLQDSGSGVYVRELTRALVHLGHEVTLVCQDREPERCDFIDSLYTLDATNESLTIAYEALRTGTGSCRQVGSCRSCHGRTSAGSLSARPPARTVRRTVGPSRRSSSAAGRSRIAWPEA